VDVIAEFLHEDAHRMLMPLLSCHAQSRITIMQLANIGTQLLQQ
jgi:hypothetical protein